MLTPPAAEDAAPVAMAVMRFYCEGLMKETRSPAHGGHEFDHLPNWLTNVQQRLRQDGGKAKRGIRSDVHSIVPCLCVGNHFSPLTPIRVRARRYVGSKMNGRND